MAELLAREAALNAALKEAKSEQGRQKRKRARDATRWLIEGPLRAAVLATYSLADYHVEPAAKYLEITVRERGWPPKSNEDMGRLVEDLFFDADLVEMAALVQLDDPSDAAALAVAINYVELQWRVVVFAREANLGKASAPSSERLLEKAEENRQRLPSPVRPPPVGTIAEPRGRKWAQRLRKRWDGHFRLAPEADALLTPEEIHAKAGL